jgi:hypothetical protein
MTASGKHIHIVSFDNPYPPNYGGAIDVYYKIKALHEEGLSITLHVFEYGRLPHTDLDKYCDKVFYYKRSKWANPLRLLPYIVATRNSKELLKNLKQDDAPILFEGMHTCYWLSHKDLAHRVKLVRMHNIEHDYYQQLAAVEPNFAKRIYFKVEAMLLSRFYKNLNAASAILAISENDFQQLRKDFNQTEYVGPFHPNTSISSKPGQGKYVLYHGNLAVGENDEAARYLVNDVFSKINVPFIIAGNQPSAALLADVSKHKHIQLRANIATQEIDELIRNAHINVLPTFQPTGIKLKLINVLYKGRFVLANNHMVSNTGCEPLCIIANTAVEMQTQVNILMKQEFTQGMIENRTAIMLSLFSNNMQAEKIVKLLERTH